MSQKALLMIAYVVGTVLGSLLGYIIRDIQESIVRTTREYEMEKHVKQVVTENAYLHTSAWIINKLAEECGEFVASAMQVWTKENIHARTVLLRKMAEEAAHVQVALSVFLARAEMYNPTNELSGLERTFQNELERKVQQIEEKMEQDKKEPNDAK